MTVYGYARVSTDGQTLDAQVSVSLSMVLDGILRILSARFAMVSGLCPSPKLPRESVDSSGNKAVLNHETELHAHNMMGEAK